MLKIKDFVLDDEDLFGYYCKIPYYTDGEKHIYKVIGRLRSNTYQDIPAVINRQQKIHDEIVDIVNVIHCGVCEDKVERFALKDVEILEKVEE